VASDEPAIVRALEGLAEFTGRTLVILGPPASGKSALLTRLHTGVEASGGRVVALRGTYRERSVPFGVLEGLDRPSETPEDGEEGNDAAEGPAADEGSLAPMAPVAIAPEAITGSRRRDGRVRSTLFGGPSRNRGPPSRDANDFWKQLLPEFRGEDAHPVALLLDDAGFFDGESREFVVDLSRRARLRPMLVAIALDSTASASGVWEEALLGRSDVDWIRLQRAAPDPREVHRHRQMMEALSPSAVRMVGYVTLLGGETTAVALARIAKLSLRQLPEALRPAVEIGLIKVRERRVQIPDRTSLPILEDLLPEVERGRWHLEVAEGLQALWAEPPPSRRIEIARHYLASAADGVAMARLFEAAEASLGFLEFDEASRLLAQAIQCLGSIRPADRAPIEPEMHLMNARALFHSGCPTDAETALREGVEGALRAGTSAAELASWIEPLLPALEVIGPRRQLTTLVVELAERLHEAGLIEPEVLLETLLPAYDAERNMVERARADALRAAQNAHRLRERHLQALGLFAMGVSRMIGSEAEMAQAERSLRAARYLLRDARRWELDYLAAEFECRLLESRGSVDQALAIRQQSVAALERARLPSVELLHELAIAQIYLDRGTTPHADGPLDRALRITDSLHLFPPSPGLLRAWLLDGRRYALAGSVEAARDRWSALIDLPSTLDLPRVRAEALLRLALLEQASGRSEEVESLQEALKAPEVLAALPAPWQSWPKELESRATSSHHGGGRLPAESPSTGPDLGHRERRRR